MKRKIIFLLCAFLLPSCRPVPNYYTVTWLNYDGSVLEVDEEVLEFALPTYDGETPLKERDFERKLD